MSAGMTVLPLRSTRVAPAGSGISPFLPTLVNVDPSTRNAELSVGARPSIPFRVLLDGQAPGPSHGVDVDEDGNGVLRDGRLYQLVRAHDAVQERTLEITFWEPGAEAYVFTFG